jgi:hypothetical protein
MLVGFWPQQVAPNSTTVAGAVYRDYNANGLRDMREPGVGDIAVQIYDATGVVAQVRSGENGEYQATIERPAGTPVRVEFLVPAGGFLSGPEGAGSGTTVQFATTPATAVDLGINRPSQFCQPAEQLRLVTTCYVFGDQQIDDPVVVDVPYTAGADYVVGRPGADYNAPTGHALAVPARAVGSTWGIATQRSTQRIFVAAFVKRHAGLGPFGTGAIYLLDANAPDGDATLFLDLNALFGPNTAGVDTRAGVANLDYRVDGATYDAVGRTGLGDIDMFEDDRTLYLMNLADRRLYEIPVGDPPVAPAAQAIGRFTLPDPATLGAQECVRDPATPAGELNRNLRPFGLGVYDGRVFVGVVCTAESTRNENDLRGYVLAFDPATDTFALAADFPLSRGSGYERGCADTTRADCRTIASAQWRYWRSDFDAVNRFPDQYGTTIMVHPQPVITDIDFDNGDMIIGMRDRFGDQLGNQAYAPTGAGSPVRHYTGLSAGDLLRACRNAQGTWDLEQNATCGGATTGGQNSLHVSADRRPIGPGGGEYYYGDGHRFHDQVASGGIVQVPGFPQVAQTVADPRPDPRGAGGGIPADDAVYDGGVRWYNNLTTDAAVPRERIGNLRRLYRLYDMPVQPPPSISPLFGKTNGLGDLEALCAPAPLEIGNRVWLDQNANGRQDPDEPPIAGVTLRLYDAGGVLIATAITRDNGEYYFRGSNAPDANPGDYIGLVNGPLQFDSEYEIRIDESADRLASGALAGLAPTRRNADIATRDSDGIAPGAGNYVFARLRTATAGYNDHTYDFGFTLPTAVTLQRFTATSDAAGVTLRWTTLAEMNTWGFHLYRGASADRAAAVQITGELVPARGGRGGGADYSFVDTAAPPGQEHWYWLQEVELNETTADYGPVRAVDPATLVRRIFFPDLRRE